MALRAGSRVRRSNGQARTKVEALWKREGCPPCIHRGDAKLAEGCDVKRARGGTTHGHARPLEGTVAGMSGETLSRSRGGPGLRRCISAPQYVDGR